ncbi:MAG: GH3 auxin-responsive promoter family protein [Candidatus Thiodiazotropha sp. (ex Lucinoma borealis)]|nr:GH3 auxin-responsive promoter family protein [Candidatus Thiodiazotropha sp. (ex Lucinoma borealis)]
MDPWLTLKAFQGEKAPGSCQDLEQCQTRWLMNCLRSNQTTLFGQRHAFADIDTIRDYQNRVPLHYYEEVSPYITRMASGEADILFMGHPTAFEQTGGSSGGVKLIPYSDNSLEDFRRTMLPWLSELVTSHSISSGNVYLTLSPATRQTSATADGIPIGLPDTAYLGPLAGQALMALSAVPTWVGSIPDVEKWQLATLYWLVRQQKLSLISLWSPSFYLQLLEGLEERQAELMELLNYGGEIAGRTLPDDKPAMARFVRYLADHDSLHLWPGLKVVSCWMEGNSRSFANNLQQRLPQAQFQGKGLLATEGVTTVPNRNGAPLLAVQSGFYEFLQEDGEVRCAWEIDEDGEYEVVLTTRGGLYRYRTGDMVRYTGMIDNLPELYFLGRNDLTSDLVGEKLSEAFVAQCLTDIPGFHMLAPVRTPEPHYTLIVSSDDTTARAVSRLATIENRLKSNPQYAYARKLGQLGPLTATTHSNPLRVYTAKASMRQRLGDVKVPALLPPTMEVELFMEDLH